MLSWLWVFPLVLLGWNMGMAFDDLVNEAKLREQGVNVDRKMLFLAILIFGYGALLVTIILLGVGVKVQIIRNGYATCFLTALLLVLLLSREYIERRKRQKK